MTEPGTAFGYRCVIRWRTNAVWHASPQHARYDLSSLVMTKPWMETLFWPPRWPSPPRATRCCTLGGIYVLWKGSKGWSAQEASSSVRSPLMAFVPQYTYDIFVSYAHVDDLPEPVTQEGWVTTLVRGLKKRLAQKLGRNDAFTLWMDHELAGHVPITPEIMHTLQHSATLLLILSPGYLASKWCQQELQTFLHTLRERAHAGSRVFIVERAALGEDGRPPELQERLGYRFWVADREGRPPRILGDPRPHPDDVRYYDLLNDLSCDLAETLQRLKHATTSQTTAAPA